MRLASLFSRLKPPRGFRLTKAGKIFFLFLLAIIVVAMLTGNNLLFLILAGMLSFMIVSGIESERNIRYLEMSRGVPSEIFAKRPAHIHYAVRNTTLTSKRLVIEDSEKMLLGRLVKGSTEKLEAGHIFPKRGDFRLGKVEVSTTYPYGLFEKSISFDLSEDIVVFPEPLVHTLYASSGSDGQGRGLAHDSISHVRGYVPGDPLSSIVWKKQHLGLISRVVEGGSGASGVVVLLPEGDLERKLSHATFIILELQKQRSPFGLIMNDYFSGIGVSRDHKFEILRHLSRATAITSPRKVDLNGKTQFIYL
ncbi:MAG TPA: hypothetical protein PKY89_00900 [Deltaproteobacteria bacterium]|nr:hypothetical protein [Deltaproteobacteria bacterium]